MKTLIAVLAVTVAAVGLTVFPVFETLAANVLALSQFLGGV